MRRFSLLNKALATALCLAVSGCAEIGEPDIGSPPVTASTASTAASPGTDNDGSVVTTTPQLPPARPEDFVQSLVVATDAGVVLIPDGAEPRLLSLELEASAVTPDEEVAETIPEVGTTRLAVDDFFRGLVVQFENGAVHWFQAEGGNARKVNVNDGLLLDVGFFNGTAEMIVAVGSQIDRVRLVDTLRFPLMSLEEGQSLLDLSSGGGLYAAALADDECGSLVFLNAAGEEVQVSRPPRPRCSSTRRPLYGSVALSEDGGAVAYTEISYRADGVEAETKLTVVDLSGGAIILSKVVGNSGDRISNLSFDGQRVAMMSEAANGDLELLIVTDAETIRPDVSALGAPISATWARLPVAAGSTE